MNVENEDMEKKDLKEEDIKEIELEKETNNQNDDENKTKDDENKAKDDEIDELSSKIMRLQADFMNYKKRVEKEKESSIAYGIESIVCELLPIIDNFQRALGSETEVQDNFYKGVSLIEKQLLNLLKNNSVEEIESLGQAFDPNLHHAVFVEESKEHKPGVVIEVFQKGYKLKDKVIRPSMVKVSK